MDDMIVLIYRSKGERNVPELTEEMYMSSREEELVLLGDDEEEPSGKEA
jgi:hypothetical protein